MGRIGYVAGLKGLAQFCFHVHTSLSRKDGMVYAEEPKYLSKVMFHRIGGNIGRPTIIQKARSVVNVMVLKVISIVCYSLKAVLYINRLQCL
jgi:hypothetical protein